MSQAVVWWAAVVILSRSSVEGNNLHQWRRVLVSQATVSLSSTVESGDLLHPSINRNLHCPNTCTMLGWCNSWCKDAANNCTFSSMIVMPTYNETNLADALTCYTERPIDYATNAKITSGREAHAKKLKENLIDGVYGFSILENFLSEAGDHTWFVLDFGKIVTFSHVVLFAQPNSNVVYHFRDLEVRVGTSAVTPPGGLATYQLFGKFTGPGSVSQMVELVSHQPLSARYVSVQKTAGAYGLQVGHVEVF
ncbi:hypothetical protein Hamer_G015953 [Homarus americanus]|uniref:Uncharacterized protein n=1 Tax=Homarus americanus TaxID=6706 RepID=A0A8J5ML59_HOMAM|nr:hypothetical protein Hamer_G015953 [Homarus americanus]